MISQSPNIEETDEQTDNMISQSLLCVVGRKRRQQLLTCERETDE